MIKWTYLSRTKKFLLEIPKHKVSWSFPKIIILIYYIRKNLRFKERFPTSGNDIFIVLVCRRTVSCQLVRRPDCERTCSGRHTDRSFWLVQNPSCTLIYFPKPF